MDVLDRYFSKPEHFVFDLIPLFWRSLMAERQTDFVTDFPTQDVITLKNIVFGGQINIREDYLAVQNVASYAAGKLLPLDGGPRPLASAEIIPLTDGEIIDCCDQMLAAHASGGHSANGDLLKRLLQAAIQIGSLILTLLA